MVRINFEILLLCLGAMIGAVLMRLFFKPEITEKIHTKYYTDTLYVNQKPDTVFLFKKEIQHVYLRDTIMLNYEHNINAFKAIYPVSNGNIYISGEVLGEVLKMGVITDFKNMIVTNTIITDKVRAITPKGLYIGGGLTGISSDMSPVVTADYLNNKTLFGYQYSMINGHTIRYARKLF